MELDEKQIISEYIKNKFDVDKTIATRISNILDFNKQDILNGIHDKIIILVIQSLKKERKELNSLNDSKNNTKNQELLELRQKNNELLSKILNKKD